MRISLVIAFLLSLTQSFSQKGNVYEIETLPKPINFIPRQSPAQIFHLQRATIEKNSALPDSLVSFRDHSFLTGILTAYQEHRPFVLSPDIIWLLISQGFARHISNNPEEFRKELVNFDGKKELVIATTKNLLGNPNSDWESLFPQFIRQISDYTGSELSNILTADFSTTTPTTRIASQITIMETVKAYFNYKVLMLGCGIPRITIEGTVKDWESILARTKYISRYKLEWWTSELEPVLAKIIDTKKGNLDTSFWMNMVKAHTIQRYGNPTSIDGWIIKFFPFTKEGKMTGLKPITRIDSLASEIVKVPFELEDVPNKKIYQMEFWAGFMGLSQNMQNYTLRPEIGWAVNNVNSFNVANSYFGRGVKTMDDLSIERVVTVPQDIFSLESIRFLHISFLKSIRIPDELAKISIAKLELNGLITPAEEERLVKLFPNTQLIINGKNR